MIYEDEINLTQAEYYMQECFELAKQAIGRTSPNPIVGAIVLDKNGKVTGKGFHKSSGFDHAEVVALKEAGEKAKSGTLIVNLEPCTHYGKTPPCTDLLLKSEIKEVVFSNYDINPVVYKKGEEVLLKNNIKVVPLVLESEGKEVNKFYFKWINTKLPWVTLKQAQTLDGKIGIKNKSNIWISSEASRKEVHYLRNIYDAVLVGATTVCADDPGLTVRDIIGCRDPIRIILDPSLKTKPSAKVYQDNSSVILATKQGHSRDLLKSYKTGEHVTILELDENKNNKIDLKDLFLELGKREILSVLIEAGPTLSGDLILNNLIDEYILFISPKVFGDSNALPSVLLKPQEDVSNLFEFIIFDYKAIGNDLILILRPKRETYYCK